MGVREMFGPQRPGDRVHKLPLIQFGHLAKFWCSLTLSERMFERMYMSVCLEGPKSLGPLWEGWLAGLLKTCSFQKKFTMPNLIADVIQTVRLVIGTATGK